MKRETLEYNESNHVSYQRVVFKNRNENRTNALIIYRFTEDAVKQEAVLFKHIHLNPNSFGYLVQSSRFFTKILFRKIK